MAKPIQYCKVKKIIIIIKIKKKMINEHIYETDSQTSKTNLRLPKGKLGRVGINQELGMNIYTLLCIK